MESCMTIIRLNAGVLLYTNMFKIKYVLNHLFFHQLLKALTLFNFTPGLDHCGTDNH